MAVEEFGGIGFAAGVVRGARSFAIDQFGRLTGVTYHQVWTPGENHAICRVDEGDTYMRMVRSLYGTIRVSLPATPPVVPPVPAPRRSWVSRITTADSSAQTIIGQAVEDQKAKEAAEERARREAEERAARDTLENCRHGFYGYYDGSNDYYREGYVAGVIEGYGEAIIGTRGFRCMKARIVALCIPAGVEIERHHLVMRNYDGIPFFDSFKDMVTQFPPDDAGSGFTPDHPDFWTKDT